MSFFSINASTPLFRATKEAYHERLQVQGEQYTISIEIGFDTASFILLGSFDYLLNWFSNGLMRHVSWKAPDTYRAWEGLVTKLSFTADGVTRTVSVEGMANRIVYVYDQINTATNPPTSNGQQVITKNNTTSQELYGIKSLTLSPGEATATNANTGALSALAALSRPIVGEVQSVAGDGPSLQVDMLGYGHTLNWFDYSQTALSGTDDASNVVIDVIGDDPNGYISTGTGMIVANATATERYWERQPALKVIQTIAQRGRESGGLGEPWVTGIYERRQLLFKPAEGLDDRGNPLSTNQYQILRRQAHRMGVSYLDQGGLEIPYWQLRPDRLVYMAGIPGKNPLYVTKVTFAPPVGIQLSGNDLQEPLRGWNASF
jgi:hypothetical protein